MADDEPSTPESPAENAPRRRRHNGRGRGRGPREDQAAAAVATVEPEVPAVESEASNPVDAAPPSVAEPVPAPAPPSAPPLERLDLAALKEMGVPKLITIGKSLDVANAASMK